MTNREKYIDNASNEEIASAICGMGLQYRYSPDTQLRVKEWLSQEVKEDKERISCNVCKYAVPNGYHSLFMYHHTCKNLNSERFNKGVDVVNDGCDKGEVKEVEEDVVNIPKIGKMPKTDKTKTPSPMNDTIDIDGNIAMLIKEIIALQERVKEIEKYSLIGRNLILTELKTPEINAVPLNGYSSIETKTADEMFEELGYKKVNKSERIVIYTNNRFDIIINEDIEEEKKNIYTKLAKQGNGVGITEAEDKAIHKKIEELKNERYHN